MIVLITNALLLEAGVRAIFAFKMGPKVLSYGTSYYRKATAEPTARKTGEQLETGFGTYSKYAPNEYKAEVDHETGDFFPVTINRQGFRGEDFRVEKPPGTVRIVTLGASSTFGFYDRDDETYPHFLELELTRRTQGSVRFEVINLGIPHLTSRQILALFRAEAVPLKPDVVTFYEAINDSSQMPHEVWIKKRDAPPQTATSRLRAAVASLGRLRDLYAALRERVLTVSLIDSMLVDSGALTYSREDFEKHIEGKTEEFLKNVAAIEAACRENGILFIAIKQQARSMLIDDIKGLTYEDEVALVQEKLVRTNQITHQEKAFLTHRLLTDSLEAWAHSHDVPFVDVIGLLNQDRDVLLSWVHLSPRGNQLIAGALAQEILRDLKIKAAHAESAAFPPR